MAFSGNEAWNGGEPNNSPAPQLCATLLTGGLRDVQCTDPYPFLCELRSSTVYIFLGLFQFVHKNLLLYLKKIEMLYFESCLYRIVFMCQKTARCNQKV